LVDEGAELVIGWPPSRACLRGIIRKFRISIGGVVLATTYSLDYSVGFGEHQDSAIKNRVSWWLSYSKRDQAIEEESGSEAP